MSEVPDALRLAHLLAIDKWPDAAEELRRLHAENQLLQSEAAHNTRILGASAETELALRARIAEMEEQMAAIGAGGVEPLRKHASPQAAQVMDAQTIKHISALSELVRMPNAEYSADAHNAAVRHLRALATEAKKGEKA